MKMFVALTIFPLNQLTFFNKSSSLNLHPIFFSVQLRLKIIQQFVYLLFSFLIVYGRNPKCIFKNDKI